MTDAIYVALIGAGGAALGSIITAIIYINSNKKNNLTSALHYASQSLDITGQELVEALLAIKEYRNEIRQKDLEMDKLQRDYKFLKDITRKLYEIVVKFDVPVGLTDSELEMLFDTQPLRLAEEMNRRRRKLQKNDPRP